MKVADQCVVSIDYTLTNDQGEMLDTSTGREPLAYLHGAGNIISGLESALTGRDVGENVTTVIPPEDAYGVRDDALVGDVPRQNLQGVDEIQVGLQLQAQTPNGPQVVRVIEVHEETVKLDANHPLAGQTLHFDVTVKDVRDATPEELQHGHVHGPGGHAH